MQFLIVWLGGLIANLVPFFTKFLVKRTAIAAATVAGSIVFVSAMAVAIKALLVGITYSLPSWAVAGAMFLPSNLPICISAVITAQLIRFAYELNMKNFRAASQLYLGG